MFRRGLTTKLINLGPIILLYYLSISESDTYFQNHFNIISFNLQLIVVYFWVLKKPTALGNGHIFFAGLINDVIMGFPLGISSLTFLTTSFVASYIKNMSVHTTLTSDWFTFLFALLISNFIFGLLLSYFSEITFNIEEISYNTFFTLMIFPFFWFFFNFYISIMGSNKNV